MKASISRIKAFKACRRMYEFRYIEGLEPVKKAEALETGLSYHSYLEGLYKTGELPDEYTKECAMAHAYKKFVFPNVQIAPDGAEKWLESVRGSHTLIGRVDGITPDGVIVEHKTTSGNLLEYEYNLQLDEQLLAYMALTGAREILYTVCQKPTIRQKKDETDAEFFERVFDWYDETKIGVIPLNRTDADVERFLNDFESICSEMEDAEKHKERLYRNTAHCNCWGRKCEYFPICGNYDPNKEYVEFTRRN